VPNDLFISANTFLLIRKNINFVSVTGIILACTAALVEDTRRNFETVANTRSFQGR